MSFQMGVLGSPSEHHLLSQRIKKIDLWSPMSFQLWHFMQKLEMKGPISCLFWDCLLCQAKLKEFQLFAVLKSEQSCSQILCLKAAEKNKSIIKHLHYYSVDYIADQINFPVDIVKIPHRLYVELTLCRSLSLVIYKWYCRGLYSENLL